MTVTRERQPLWMIGGETDEKCPLTVLSCKIMKISQLANATWASFDRRQMFLGHKWAFDSVIAAKTRIASR